ncbi:MAG: antitoxin [Solirubrobacteraceae bacterium]
MGFAERFKSLTKKAEDEAATHKEQVHKAVLKAEEAADRQTGGQYHDQITKAGAKADVFVDGLKAPDAPAPAQEPRTTEE